LYSYEVVAQAQETNMQTIRLALLAVFTVLVTGLPAAAQTAAASSPPTLILVWAWILVAGIAIFGIGTCLGMSSGKK
jgi:hypothetical protein